MQKLSMLAFLFFLGCTQKTINGKATTFTKYVILNADNRRQATGDKFKSFKELSADSFPLYRLLVWNKAEVVNEN